MNKKIGIIGWKTGENSFGVTTPYLTYFAQFGDPIILMPKHNPNEVVLDLLVLPGGKDLDSTRYGEVPGFENSSIDPYKQYFYDHYLDEYILKGTPIFGICLGFQMLCVKFGLKLVQHLMDHPISAYRDELTHEIISTTDSPENEIFNNIFLTGLKPKKSKKVLKVNSLHHQGVSASSFATYKGPLENLVVSLEDGIVEVVGHKYLPMAGVQWHPEEINDALSANIIYSLLALSNVDRAKILTEAHAT